MLTTPTRPPGGGPTSKIPNKTRKDSSEPNNRGSYVHARSVNAPTLMTFAVPRRVRKFCQHLCSRKWFDYGVLFFIALNCITLAMERPDIPKNSAERQFLTIANYVFTFIFTVEMTVKVSVVSARTLEVDDHNLAVLPFWGCSRTSLAIAKYLQLQGTREQDPAPSTNGSGAVCHFPEESQGSLQGSINLCRTQHKRNTF